MNIKKFFGIAMIAAPFIWVLYTVPLGQYGEFLQGVFTFCGMWLWAILAIYLIVKGEE